MNPAGILVVEDDHFVLKFLKQAVPQFYQGNAYFAKSAEEALEVWQRHSAEITTLLTDLTLPGIAGEELARRLVAEKRSLRVIISTGRPISLAVLESKIGAKAVLLEKPFQPIALAEVFSGELASELLAA